VRELQRHLTEGNVADGAELCRRPGKSVDDFLRTWPRDSVEGMEAATTIAELEFALGHDHTAERCLKDYENDKGHGLLSSHLPARHKLQLAEYHYASLALPKAIEIGERILAEARSANDHVGTSEAHFYLARFRLRSDAFKEANNDCMLGLESLLRQRTQDGSGRKAIRWQTGRLLRVRGAALWQQGRLTEANAVLYLSAWILRDAFGDAKSLHVGDALHSLGRLLRSVTRFEEAIEKLEEALDHYENHELKSARTLMELARTRHNMALALGNESKPDAKRVSRLFDKAQEELATAIRMANRGKNAPKVWRRQKAESLLWKCWLTLEGKRKPRNLEQARSAARIALDESIEIGSRKSDLVEAKIALGHCEMELGEFAKAKDWFVAALGQADELGRQNPKLRTHACLSLAQLECRADGSAKDAQKHFDEAFRGGDSSAEISSYLSAKADAIEKEIHKLATASGTFIMSLETLLERTPEGWAPLEVLETLARKWALDALGKGVSIKAAAKKLGIAAGTYANIKKEARKLDEAERKRAHRERRDGSAP
jgi:tetratricopeptide (TPR) repeat protein